MSGSHPKKVLPNSSLHPRNIHQERYPLDELNKTEPELSGFIFENEYGNITLDFSNPKAVKILNKALLKHFYKIEFWDIPAGFLCPPIPGRADYIHYLADLLAQSNGQKIPTCRQVKVLDIGTGANLIYPILGNACYGWEFVGAEIEPKAIKAAQVIIDQNPSLQTAVKIRQQQNSSQIFHGIIQSEDFFDLTLCNPPFHESAEAAAAGSLRKIKNLTGNRKSNPVLNFGGQSSELWCEGGESAFITRMIQESINFRFNCLWFTTLVAKETTLPKIYDQLKKSGVAEFKTISMAQGNKISRLVAWTFLQPKQVQNWQKLRWNRKS